MVEKNKKQTMRFSDNEMQLIKEVFGENEELLFAIRKVFLQYPLDAIDKSLLEIVKKPEVMKIVRKCYLPELEMTAPFFQVADLWMFLELKGKSANDAYIDIQARKLVMDYVSQQLTALEGGVVKDVIVFKDLEKILPRSQEDQMLINMTARNMIIYHSEQQISQLYTLAGVKKESIEETKKRLAKDSSK